VKGYYDYAKESNSFVKAGLQTAENYSQPVLHKLEEYSHQPSIESLLHKVDQFGCRQLDKVEAGGHHLKETYDVLKPKTLQTLENVANRIHGTPIEVALLKTVGAVDVVVDSLLPPDPEEPADVSEVPSDDPNVLDRATPVIKKLKTRVSKDSIKRLPSQTYTVSKDIIFRNADAIPHVHYCIGVLNTAAHRVRDASVHTQAVAKNGIHKGAQLSQQSIEYLHQSLQHLTTSLTKLVIVVKKLDPIEARASLEELTAMIQHSKDQLLANKYFKDSSKVKEDISHILQKAGDLLSQHIAAGYTRVQSYDSAAVRKSVEKIENLVLRIVDSLSGSRTENNQSNALDEAPAEQQSYHANGDSYEQSQ
jgi:hypothetical protein